MPIWLRKTTQNLIIKHYQEEKEAMEKASGAETVSSSPQVSRPDIKPPSYTTTSRK